MRHSPSLLGRITAAGSYVAPNGPRPREAGSNSFRDLRVVWEQVVGTCSLRVRCLIPPTLAVAPPHD
jgi:hypothetical protein